MIALQADECRRFGFQPLVKGDGWKESEGIREQQDAQDKEPVDYFGLIKRGFLFIFRRREDDNLYMPHVVRDTANLSSYGPAGMDLLFPGAATLDDVMSVLENPRWIGVDAETRGMLRDIAETPSAEDAEPLIEETYERVRNYQDERIKSKLEIELEGAITAHQAGNPAYYLSGNRNGCAFIKP